MEGAVIAALIALGVFLIYHFTVHKIHNSRPLGGVNVEVTRGVTAAESEANFATDPGRPGVLFGASNQLLTYTSQNAGRTWRSDASPLVREPACARGEPHPAAGKAREYLAFLVSPACSDQLTAFVAVTSRAVGAHHWASVTRVAPATWHFGFDDAPSLAVDVQSGRLYLSWTRGLAPKLAAVVASRSVDGGKTWSTPVVVAKAADEPHLSTIAVAPGGDVYIAGIDAPHGIWITRSTDDAKTFTAPRAAAPLRANPSSTCAGQSSFAPLPNEETSCIGPNPTVLATAKNIHVVYDDVGANGTPNVYDVTLDRALHPIFTAQVNPPDHGHTQQFFPTAALDQSTGALWACWYDTTFDAHAHRAWFTCSASRTGRTWTPPERASAGPTAVADLFTDLRTATGFSPSVAAGGGVAHAFWIEIDPQNFAQRISTASLPERTAFLTLQR